MTLSEKYLKTYSDKKLMRLISKKNSEALKILYEKYNVNVYNFILRYTNNKEIAEDILQLTFTKVWYASHTFNENRGEFKSWLFTISLNIARNEMTKKRYTYHYMEMDEAKDLGNSIIEKNEKTPAECIELMDLKEVLSKAIAKLKPYYKEVIIMKHFSKLKFREISEITNTPEGTLKARFHKAIMLLREELKSMEL